MTLDPRLDFFAITNLVGVGQALFWAAALLGLKRSNKTANRILAALLVCLAFGVTSATLYSTGYILSVPHAAELATPVLFLCPPLVLLYVMAMTKSDFSLKRHLYHFAPFTLCVLYLLPFYLFPGDQKLELLHERYASGNPQEPVLSLLVLASEVVYIIWTLRMLRRHGKRLRHSYSTLERVNLNWLRNLIFGFLAVTALYFFFMVTNWTVGARVIVPASITVFVYVMGYQALRQPQVFTLSGNGYRKYQKSGLTEKRAEKYLEKLLTFMEHEQPYLDPNLTLSDLAGQVSLSPNHLSQLLNDNLNQTFFDFVNSYRVQAAQRELRNPEKSHLTILAIAYEVGFNSKSSFNSAFKKHTNMTPSEFRRTLPVTA